MILSNQVRCNHCGDEPFSGSVHDFRRCKCGRISVDGGMSYLRRVGDINGFTEMSIEISDEAYKAAKEAVQWANRTGRNELGMICAIARALRDNGVQLVDKSII